MGYNTIFTEWPSPDISKTAKDLIDKFFNLLDNDDSSVGDILADEIFTSDAVSGFSGHLFRGSEEIRKSRQNAWKVVKSRKHTVDKVYVCNEAQDDLMFIGTVTMGLHNGKEVSGEFTGRLKISEPSSPRPRLQLYQVWADSAPMTKALQEG